MAAHQVHVGLLVRLVQLGQVPPLAGNPQHLETAQVQQLTAVRRPGLVAVAGQQFAPVPGERVPRGVRVALGDRDPGQLLEPDRVDGHLEPGKSHTTSLRSTIASRRPAARRASARPCAGAGRTRRWFVGPEQVDDVLTMKVVARGEGEHLDEGRGGAPSPTSAGGRHSVHGDAEAAHQRHRDGCPDRFVDRCHGCMVKVCVRRRIRGHHGFGPRRADWSGGGGRSGEGLGGDGTGGRGLGPDRPAPDERADRRRAVHLDAHRREPRVGDAAQAATPRSAQPGPARRGHARACWSSPAGAACPSPVTPFIGRTAERAALAAALAEHRMVTATGPGGVGKTRLALSVAAELAPARRDGAWFVDLVHVTDPAMVAAAVAETVGVPEQRTHLDRPRAGRLARRAATRCSSSTTASTCSTASAHCVERIIAGCPEVTVLATSRTRLLAPVRAGVRRTGAVGRGGGGDAVDLFAARVAAATGEPAPPDPRRVAALCRALDGMALAIELAAARFAALGLDGLEAGLDQRLRFLTAGTRVADRHGSLRDAIGWSYDLLSPDDRRCCAASPCSPRGSTSTRPAPSPADRRTCRDRRRAGPPGRATACSSSSAASRPGTGRWRRSASTASSGWTQAGELDQIRAGHERWCRAGRRRAPPAGRRSTRLGAPGSTGSSTTSAPRSPGRPPRSADGRRRRRWPPSLPGCCSSAAGRRRRSDATSRPPNSPPRRRERAAYLRLAAGAAASRFVGDEALRLFRMAADAAVSVGDRAGAARDLATMAMYINRAPGIMATPHSRAKPTRWSPKPEPRRTARRSPRRRSPRRRSAAVDTRPGGRSTGATSRRARRAGRRRRSCTASPWTC